MPFLLSVPGVPHAASGSLLDFAGPYFLTKVKQFGRHAFERVESLFDAAFGVEHNPLYHLGALGWFFYWIVAVSGIYLYIFFDTGVSQAYESVEYLTQEQWYAGGLARSLHRYASDALIIVMMLHLVREFVMDRLRGPRSFTWIIGIAILWLVFASGITGYWIVWDKLAQYVAIASSEWLDSLPLFGQSIARNFLHDSTLSGRFFTLMVFIHIAVPLILLFVMWIHIQRVTSPDVNPPRALGIAVFAMLVILSFVYPAQSQGPADLSRVTSNIGLDWFYMALYPLLDIFSGMTVWGLVGVMTVVLFLLPWAPRKKTFPAIIDLGNCNGCERCVNDCPFGAISMQPRSDERAYSKEAVVSVKKCVGCGICVGSCPTATPFRRRSPMISGIELSDKPVMQLRDQVISACAAMTESPKVLVYNCATGPDLSTLSVPGLKVLTLPCIGQLPPSFIDFILSRGHADGVFLTGCRPGDCHYRLGIDWTEQRINGERDPYLRERVPRERIGIFWAGVDRFDTLTRQLNDFRERLRQLQNENGIPSQSTVKEDKVADHA